MQALLTEITDFIPQYLIEHMANGTEVCLSIRLQYNLSLQLFSMLVKLNILYKLHITIHLNSAFPNSLINPI